jgi:hypothetical protein
MTVWRKLTAALTRNTVTRTGAVLVVVAIVLILLLAAFERGGLGRSLRLQLVAYAVLPAFIVLGLILMPIGLWWQRRRERRRVSGGALPPPLPVFDLNDRTTRGVFLLAGLLGCCVLLILAGAGYRGVGVLESTEFCTEACHKIMQPEASSHERSPHANVACATCHVGPGARWFVTAKINGIWELVQVVLDSFPRPIPTPIHNLRPARVVCEQCHWPSAFVGDRLVVHTRYGEDEANTSTKTVLMLHVGGEIGKVSAGIHWHISPGNRIRYLTNPAREAIYVVELTMPDGSQKTFKNDAVPPVDAQWRTMDCVDCHNRPTHIFGTPAHEVDAALEDGRIDTSLTFIKREALRVLQADYPSQEQARAAISREITDFYRTNYPDVAAGRTSAVSQAGRVLGDIWAANVFPQMKVTWNTHPDHIGHQQSPGCWRCHDNKHVAATGEHIRKSCGLCHHVVAEDEAAPEALKPLE